MSTPENEHTAGSRRQPTEEELRAYEAELRQLRIEQVLLEHVVTLVNLGMRRTGLAAGTEDERDVGQVRLAIEAVRSLLPLVESAAPAQAGPIRDALSQLQLAFVRIGGQGAVGQEAPGGAGRPEDPSPASPGEASKQRTGGEAGQGAGGGAAGAGAAPQSPEPGRAKAGEPGPAQRSGRLWVPGQ